jgi:putative nucleotidyltransferase with HDIG domain
VRRIFLLRHGEVDCGGVKRCIGRTDLPLSERGKSQVARLGIFFDGKHVSVVYTSPAQRARLTADSISRGLLPVKVCDALGEIDMGDWEGLSFAEIRERYPELYARRGENPGAVIPPNGESLANAQARAVASIEGILGETRGTIAVVAHAGINRLLICKYRNLALNEWLSLPQPYGCVNVLLEREGSLTVEETGKMPVDAPDEQECLRLLWEKGTPLPVIEHCRAVAKKAAEITRTLTTRGIAVDGDLVYAGAMLHDIARSHKNHAQTGADWLKKEGYPVVADIIAGHEDLREPAQIDETAVVCLADKLVLGTAEVSLEERFAYSLEKCYHKAARIAHEKRFRQALWLREQIIGRTNETTQG